MSAGRSPPEPPGSRRCRPRPSPTQRRPRPAADDSHLDCDRSDLDRDSDRDRRNREREREEAAKTCERQCREKQAEREREKDLESIKEQYLGSKKPKKRVNRARSSASPSTTEDTSRDMNALYQNSHEARPLYGRSFLAGIDSRKQKKHLARQKRETVRPSAARTGWKNPVKKLTPSRRRKLQLTSTTPSTCASIATGQLDEMMECDWCIFG